MIHYLKKHFNIPSANKILVGLLLIDFILIITHTLLIVIPSFSESLRPNFNIQPFLITYDGGYPEIYQYLKFLGIIVAITYIIYFKKRKNKKAKNHKYLLWGFLFLLLFLDDAFQLHERVGAWFSEQFNSDFNFLGLKSTDIGELIYILLMGGILLIIIIYSLMIHKGKKFKNKSYDILFLMGFLIFFGVGVDFFHGMFREGKYANYIFGIIEDGGEMIALSLLLWYFVFLVFKATGNNKYLHKYFFKRRKNFQIT